MFSSVNIDGITVPHVLPPGGKWKFKKKKKIEGDEG